MPIWEDPKNALGGCWFFRHYLERDIAVSVLVGREKVAITKMNRENAFYQEEKFL